MRTFLAILAAAALWTSPAYALRSLEGNDALVYLNNEARAHLVSGGYSYHMLSRTHRDSMNGRFSDGVLFCPGNGRIEFRTRKDGECIAIFNSPAGREMPPVTDDAWRDKIQNALADDNPRPTIFFDDKDSILAIVYAGKDAKLKGSTTEDGLLRLELSIPGARDRGRVRRRGPF